MASSNSWYPVVSESKRFFTLISEAEYSIQQLNGYDDAEVLLCQGGIRGVMAVKLDVATDRKYVSIYKYSGRQRVETRFYLLTVKEINFRFAKKIR